MRKEKDEVKIVSQKQIEKQLKHIGSVRLRPGHTCFEINNSTKEVEKAKIETVAHLTEGIKHKVITKDGYSYINALNAKNALKHFNKNQK